MDVKNMHFLFGTLLETMWKEFETEERPDSDIFLKFLNLAKDRYLKEKYLNKGSLQENVEFIQKRSDDLRNLIKRNSASLSVESLSTVSGPANRYLITLPTDYLFYVRSDSYITRTALPVVSGEWVPNRETTYYEISKISTSPYNLPILRNPVVVFEESNKILLYTDSYTTVSKFGMNYLRKQKDLVFTVADSDTEADECELAEHTHEEIVRLTVELYTMDYKFRLQTKEAQKAE